MSVSSAKSVWLGRAESFINPQEFKIFSGEDDTVSYLLNQYMDAVIYFTYDNDVMRLELTNDKYEENILPQASLDRVGVEGKWQFSDDEEKQKAELRSLLAVNNSFRKLVVSKSYGRSWIDENGILRIGLIDFLLDQNSLDR